MPSRPGRVCGTPGCAVIVHGAAYCPAHKREDEKRRDTKTAEAKAFYNSRRWRNYREIYLRKHPLCVECERKDVITLAKIVDHITPMSEGGEPWDEKNHQGLCVTHHQRKRQQESQRARRGG